MAMMVREVIVTMMVMREVMQPVEDELADDKLSASAGEIDRVIREGCPFLWGWKGYSSGGRWDLCWEEDVSAGEEGNLRLVGGNVRPGGREISVGRRKIFVGRGESSSGGRECSVGMKEISVGRKEISVWEIGVPRICAGRVSGRGSWGVRGQKGV